MEDYADEVKGIGIDFEVQDGIKPLTSFFAISTDDLRNTFHVSPSDSVEVAKAKIMKVVTTDEFLFKYFNKDPRIWEIKKFKHGFWTVPVKNEKILSTRSLAELGYDEEKVKKNRPVVEKTPVRTNQCKLSIEFVKRKIDSVLSDESWLDLYQKEMKAAIENTGGLSVLLKQQINAALPRVSKNQKYDPEKLLLFPDVELHLGKLASAFDSADPYDHKRGLYRYGVVVNEAEKFAQTVKPGIIVMTIGNDFFNTDTEKNTTTAGTEQHNDTRFQQMIISGVRAHIEAIERMKRNCGKLILMYQPGNHDYLIDFLIYNQLNNAYKNDPKVEIKYLVEDLRHANGIAFGDTYLIVTHGKGPDGKALSDKKLADLRHHDLFINQTRNARNIIVQAGHLHNSYDVIVDGVQILRNGSPCGDGAWDVQNLYASDKSHQLYVIDSTRGYYGKINIKLTPDELKRGINSPMVNYKIDYDEAITKSIERSADDIMTETIKRTIRFYDKKIKEAENKFVQALSKMDEIIELKDISPERKRMLFDSLCSNDEIKSYVAEKERLENMLQEHTSNKRITKRLV